MHKRAISVTLSPDNLVWLEATARRWGRRSMSDALDRILDGVRRARTEAPGLEGMLEVDPSDPELLDADTEIRRLFSAALSLPSSMAGASVAHDGKTTTRRTRRRR